ncbi:hypothetical protein HYV30_02975 [Candidatus Kaiserbacteria bacterium]|nr:hypothetical protein [Candidatus Kaiserbacteria bacterium]
MPNETSSKAWVPRVLIAVACVLVGVGVVVLILLSQRLASPVRTVVPLPANSRVYENRRYGFSVDIPQGWTTCGVEPAHSGDRDIAGPLAIVILVPSKECLGGTLSDLPIMSALTIHDDSYLLATYPTLSALEEGLRSVLPGQLFSYTSPRFGQVGLFEVADVTAIELNGMPALRVVAYDPMGIGKFVSTYRFARGKLLNYVYFVDGTAIEDQILRTIRDI